MNAAAPTIFMDKEDFWSQLSNEKDAIIRDYSVESDGYTYAYATSEARWGGVEAILYWYVNTRQHEDDDDEQKDSYGDDDPTSWDWDYDSIYKIEVDDITVLAY